MQVFVTRKTPVLGGVLNQLTCFTKIRVAVRIMKLIAILLLGGCLQLSARGVGQTITISLTDAPLQKVFQVIEQQTDYVFFVKTELLKMAKSVTIKVSNLPLQQVLDLCFKNQPLKYSINGKIITIAPRTLTVEKEGNATGINQGNPFGDIKGRILNADGEPVSGATISVKGANIQTVTNANGEFTLSGVADNAIITVSHIQYETASLSLKGNSFLSATLQVKVNSLDELQVIAYGTTTKRFNTGNVATVKSSEIERQPVNNPLLALAGRVPGLLITQATGLPGSGVTVRIQGQNSMAAGSDPLYVIDGVPYVSQLLPTISRIQGSSEGTLVRNGSGNPLTFLNPGDIESIEVLKDADATSIYGSQAAAGAILITTKKGKVGKTKLNVNLQNGWGKITRKLDLMNTEQYLEMRKEAYNNDGTPMPNSSSTPSPDKYDLTVWDQDRYTNWQDVLIGGTAKYFDAQASVSGGTSNTQFLIGTGFHRETTVFPSDVSDKKSSLHFNISNTSANQKFKLQLSGNYLVDNNRLQLYDLTNYAIRFQPNAPMLYNEDGTLNWAPLPNGTSTWTNPLSYSNRFYKINTNNLVSNGLIGYKLLNGLEIKSNFGYTNLQSKEVYTLPLSTFAPDARPLSTRSSTFGNNEIRSWIIEPQVTYAHNFGRGKLEALIGSTFLKRISNGQQFFAFGFNSDAVMEDIKSAPNVSVSSTINSTYNYNALFGRINYKWFEKYIFNFTARRDGSSRFGSKNLFANFWSLAGAWIFSQEPIIAKNIRVLSFGKLRASYGITGNDQIGDYRFMNLYNPVSAPTAYQSVIGLAPNGIPNPYVQWEETKKMQLGIDVGFFTNRILLGVNYFRNRSSNQLLALLLPQLTGFQAIDNYNLPATIENKGWEVSLQTKNFTNNNFSWSSSLNLTVPKNKLVDFPELSTSPLANLFVVGEPFTITKVYHYLGVDPATGLYLVSDMDGNPTSNPNASTDKTVLINTSPKFYGGFQNTFSYKGLELDALFQFVKQVGANYYFGGNYPGQGGQNQPVSVLDRWQKVDDVASIQKYTNTPTTAWRNAYGGATGSDKAYSDASFIRLKNVSLSWNMGNQLKKRVHLESCRLFLQAQNLLTITNYPGLDPENRTIQSLPPLRVLTIGIQLTL